MNFTTWVSKIVLFFITALASLFAPPVTTSLPAPPPPPPQIATTTPRAETKTLIPPLAQRATIATKQVVKDPLAAPIIRIISDSSNLPKSKLDPLEIITITNRERAKTGAMALTWNPKLAESALAKAKDMIAKQYFAHKSPSGVNVSDLAALHGYAYSLVGENLALGDFKSSDDVMNGWMNSPGHRKNILKPAYTEIGVAAIMGAYQGRQVWYAVQEFGRPPPNCPPPDVAKEALIKSSEAKMDEMAAQLALLKQKIDSGTGTRDETNANIDQYNALAASHNDLLNSLKGIIASYNSEVTSYNACIAREEAIIGPPDTTIE